MHFPQSSSWLQPLQTPHLRERYPNGPSPFRFTKFDGFLTLATFGSDKPGLSDSEGDPTSATTRDVHQSVKQIIIHLQVIVADHLTAAAIICYVLLSTNNLVKSLVVTIYNIS